jgi:predicted small lipoprotein YifL
VNLASKLRLAVLALALGLAGCGVKGPLEPPLDSGIEANTKKPRTPTATATRPTGRQADESRIGRLPGQTTTRGTTSRAVTVAPAANQSSPLDWLID